MSKVQVWIIVIVAMCHALGFMAAYFAAKESPGWTGAEICALAWCVSSFIWSMQAMFAWRIKQ